MSNTNENLTPAAVEAAAAAMLAEGATKVEKSRPSWKIIVGALLGTAVVGGGVYFAVSRQNAKNRAARDGHLAQINAAEAAGHQG